MHDMLMIDVNDEKAIFICTILGGIFISLVAGIILEATLYY